MTPSHETPLSARSNHEFCLVPLTCAVEEALSRSTGRKIVVINADASPVGVADAALLAGVGARSRLVDVIHTLPTTVIVDAAVGQSEALRSWAFSHTDRSSSVVFTRDGAVVGVWSGPELAVLLARVRWRVNQDMHLPGDSNIPMIVRACHFQHEAVCCPTVLTFTEYPERRFPCPNLTNLPVHEFEWKKPL